MWLQSFAFRQSSNPYSHKDFSKSANFSSHLSRQKYPDFDLMLLSALSIGHFHESTEKTYAGCRTRILDRFELILHPAAQPPRETA